MPIEMNTDNNIHNHQRFAALLLGCLLAVFILSAYSNSLFAPLTLDDSHSFVTEPKVLGFSFSLDAVAELAKTKFGLYRFVPMLTFALDLQWGSGSLMAFHITNVIIHLAATLALYFLLRSLFAFQHHDQRLLAREWRIPAGLVVFFVTGLWALNPVQTNAVTYIVQRMTSLAALFYFLSLGCYLQGRVVHVTDGWRKKVSGWYVLALFFWPCAMMSKQIAVTLPCMVLLIEWLFVDSSGLFIFIKRRKWIVSIAAATVAILIFYKISSGMLDGYAHRHFTLSERLFTELRVVSSYIIFLLLPLPQFLNLEHDVIISTSLFSPVSTLVSLLFLSGVIIGSWEIRKKYPLVTFGFCWFFINLLLESTIFPLELKFEHRLYLPSAGFYLASAMILHELYAYFFPKNYSGSRTKVMISMMVILFSCLSLSTYYRNMVWQDSVTLYQDCLKKSPKKPRVRSNLAKAFADQGEYKKAIVESDKALALGTKGYEEYWVTASNIIASLFRMGDNQAAIERANVLLEQAPPEAKKNAFPLFLLHLGNIYLEEQEYQHAFDNYVKGFRFSTIYDLPFTSAFEDNMICALETGLQEGFSFENGLGAVHNAQLAAYEKMAEICFELKKDDLTLIYCDYAMAEDSSSAVCVEIREKIDKFQVADRVQQEKGTIRTKYFNNPVASTFNFYMATAYILVKNGFPADSITKYFLQAAKKMHPDNVDVILLYSWLYYKEKSYEAAVNEIDKAIALDGEYAQLWINRGIYCLAASNNTEALTAFRKAMTLYPDYPHGKKLEAMILAAERGRVEKIISHEYHGVKGESYGLRKKISS
jgi:tetratricopeptide (TPR) repeat protein